MNEKTLMSEVWDTIFQALIDNGELLTPDASPAYLSEEIANRLANEGYLCG